MGWRGHIARMRGVKIACTIIVRNIRGGYILGDLGIGWRIILKQILKRYGLDSSSTGYGPMAGHGNAAFGSMKFWNNSPEELCFIE
jgi:hypothetical protein